MLFVRELGSIPVLKGGSKSLQVGLLPYSHKTCNEDKKVAQLWTVDRTPAYHAL